VVVRKTGPLRASREITFRREEQVKAKISSFLTNQAIAVVLLAVTCAVLTASAAAQSGCLKGNVMFALNVNGRVELCSQYLDKIPELQKQLDQLQKTSSGDQELLRELTRSARSINGLGRNVDSNRQVELLQSFSRELQGLISVDQKKTQQQMAQLADKLDNLQDKITQSREDQQTAIQIMTALNGKLGDAIAALDLTKAEQQLEAIQANLKNIETNTARTNQLLEEQAAREKEAAERQKKEAEAQENDPNLYTRAQIIPYPRASAADSKTMSYWIYMFSRPPLYPPFIDSRLSIAFRKATNSWRVDLSDKSAQQGAELWKVNFDEVGDRATLCFVAHDKASGRLREWTQHYRITPSSSERGGVNFIPDGEPSMRLIDGVQPCDGVTNARSQPSPDSAESIAATPQEQYAKMLAQAAAMREQLQRADPSPNSFANISAGGSRRDHMSGGRWWIWVDTQPLDFPNKLYDVKVEANLVDSSGRVTLLQFFNRQLSGDIESRYAWADHMGTQAVVCMIAKDPNRGKTYRLTQHFTIETGRVNWNDGGAQHPGDQATFVPSAPPTLTDANNLPCQ